MNMLDVEVENGAARTLSGLAIPLSHHLAGLTAARHHTLGVRANHLAMRRHAASDVEIDAAVDLAEISGSETFVHVHNGDLRWVVQEEGVHEYELGQRVKVYLDPARLYAFAGTGMLEVAPDRAAAAAAAAAVAVAAARA
jgi:glycerol transport system ATP-binding protein